MNIVIFINGGNVTRVVTDQDAKVTIIDNDVKGLDHSQLKTVLGEDGYVYNGIKEAEVEPETVAKVIEEVNS